ncbi:magnesium/cobalt transporter CorA [Fictibacillus aquaticus]|uniref:Magnesium transport protein CorA n=1 Tax=Fictibacillus aquaticus TaxID=2021314 RepID=A0A235FDY6_9BACL|nr:magnesium/cobalt transporter CorA [Fictibacillus aquaticus]OYD59558.1 magnesium and cobalt transport protein CorA [Fictibacillus aquaticus]
MLRVIAKREKELVFDVPLEQLKDPDIKWYWVDISEPDAEEEKLLLEFFQFHPLAVEDCLNELQRPKLEYYDDHQFLVVHAIDEQTMKTDEVDIFFGSNFVVSFHLAKLKELDFVWNYVVNTKKADQINPMQILYKIMDKLVDSYFPILHNMEDAVIALDDELELEKPKLINELFDIRAELLRLRKTIVPMRELLYRMLESKRITISDKRKAYFQDIYDHLIKLAETLDSIREMTSDIRDNYISLSSHRMNTIMKTLTVITTIFMPLTFIAGIYGMNFAHMPELNYRYGYFAAVGFMVLIGASMFWWFKRKGWFDQK